MNHATENKLLRLVKHNYASIADDFHQTRQKGLWPEIVKLTSEVPNNSRLLDVGCGNGRLLEALADKNIHYTGLDNCPELLALAAKNFPHQANNFHEAELLNLNKYPGLNYDYIFSIGVLHHIPGQRLRLDAMKQLKNKLAPQGQLIISVWNLWQSTNNKGVKFYRHLIWKFWFLKILGKHHMDFGDIIFNWKHDTNISQRYYHAFTMRELKRLAKLSGFKIKDLYKDTYNYYLLLSK